MNYKYVKSFKEHLFIDEKFGITLSGEDKNRTFIQFSFLVNQTNNLYKIIDAQPDKFFSLYDTIYKRCPNRPFDSVPRQELNNLGFDDAFLELALKVSVIFQPKPDHFSLALEYKLSKCS